jgi:hypothetical protein
MSRQQPIELFMPPNTLRAKAGGGFGGIDMAALKRAETTLESLKSEFGTMAGEGVAALAAAHKAYAAEPSLEHRDTLLRTAHDLKGLAGTLGYPLMGRLSGSLSRLVAEFPVPTGLPLKLVEAHVAAIHLVLRSDIKGDGDQTSLALLEELGRQVSAATGKS